MSLRGLLNVNVQGPDTTTAPPVVFVHGFGCGQEMWRHVVPFFTDDRQVVLLDLPGSGQASPESYDPVRHASLDGYVDDLAATLRELDLGPVVLVGHSVSAMIVVLVQVAHPELVDRLVLVAPSARYVDDGDYRGGFSAADIDELLELMDRNHLGWQDPLSVLVAGSAGSDDGAAVKDELEASFCRMRPDIAAEFAAVTFRGDNRADLARVDVPTLVIQSEHDDVAPLSAGLFVRDAIAGARLEVIATRGHCPHLSAPDETAAAIERFLAR